MENIGYFDGHNDVLLKLFFSKSKNKIEDFFEGNNYCHIDYKKIKTANFFRRFFCKSFYKLSAFHFDLL